MRHPPSPIPLLPFTLSPCCCRRYANRTSSAHWDADEMTLVEKRVYRKHMGYDAGKPHGAAPSTSTSRTGGN